MNYKFQGTYFSEAVSGGRASIDVVFTNESLVISSTQVASEWSYRTTRIEIGGSNNHLIFFANQSAGSDRFYIPTSRDLLTVMGKVHQPEWQLILKKSSTQSLYSHIGIVCVVIAVLLLVGIPIYYRSEIAGYGASFIPYKVEQSVGDKLAPVVLKSMEIISDVNVSKALQECLQPLIDVLPEEFRNIKLHVAKTEVLNAFALPGGHLVFNLGVLNASTNGNEVLGVAAHELAHVTKRHVVRNLLQGAGMFVLLQTIMGDVSGLIAILMDQGGFLMQQSFSREMETEADRVGFEYLIKANIDPRGMRDFFAKILAESASDIDGAGGKGSDEKVEAKKSKERKDEKKEQANSSAVWELLSTHPDTQRRIDNIAKSYEELSPETRKQLKTEIPAFKRLKTMLKKI